MVNADEWFVEGRPEHPDFLRLADVALQVDATAEEGRGGQLLTELMRGRQDEMMGAAISASDDIASLSTEPLAMMTMGWSVGFSAGIRSAHGMRWNVPVNDEDADQMYAGVDSGCVHYVARQRGQRALDTAPTDTGLRNLVIAVWMDGFLIATGYAAAADAPSAP